jgi:hypothetical protein
MTKFDFQYHVFDFAQKIRPTIVFILYLFTIIIIVFKDTIPESIHHQADSFLGRLFAVLLIIVVVREFGWILGLFTALAVALLIGSRMSMSEGFDDLTTLTVTGKKWFVERALNENPMRIQEDRVNTVAVQDNTRGAQSSNGGVQNSSLG